MNVWERNFIEEDRAAIFLEQQLAIEHVFNSLDLSKIAFVGGIADYINLRSYYDMPVNDLDIIYEKEEDLSEIIKNGEITRHLSKFYKMNIGDVLVSEFNINGKNVHTDFYKRLFSKINLTKSPLLGHMVWHASFKEMKKFHNNQIPELTSEVTGKNYEWKRLYKHSKKASLYNNVSYLEEKKLLHTLKR
jgi:hypothetical protein